MASGKLRKLATFFEDDEYIVIEENIPRQLRDKGDLAYLTSSAEAVGDTLKAGFALTFILNLLLNNVMSLLWNIFNTLQIIMALPMLNVLMPANVVFVQKILDDIVNFQVVDKKTLQETIIAPIFGSALADNTSDQSAASQFKNVSLLL